MPDQQPEKPTKDLPAPNTDKITGGRKRAEDPDAGGEIFKKKG
jgi:hypothetical protein